MLAVTGQAEEAGNLTDRALKLTERAFSGMVSKEVLTRVLTAGETMEAMGNYIKVTRVC